MRISNATRRLSPEASRTAALEAARALLIEAGPQAVTLKAVGLRVGRTHANLLHHFGSAAGLQKALAASMAEQVCATIATTVRAQRQGAGSARGVVDLVFDAFDRDGAGALASWMLVSDNEDALDPIIQAVHDLVDELGPDGQDEAAMRRDSLLLILMALGDSLLGAPMAQALSLGRGEARDMATRLMDESLGGHGERTVAIVTPAR